MVLGIPDQYAGQTGRCKGCGGNVSVPNLPPAQDPSIKSMGDHPGGKPEAATQRLDSITGHVSKAATDYARNLSENAHEKILMGLTEIQLRSIGEKIATALENGKRPRDIAKQLVEITELDSLGTARLEAIREELVESGMTGKGLDKRMERELNKLLKERRETIANTVGRHATSTAREVEALVQGAKWKHWSANSDEHLCDICAGNEADGVIPVDATFSGGTRHAPAHPNCRCSVSYFSTEKGRDIAVRLNERDQEETRRVRAEAARRKSNP